MYQSTIRKHLLLPQQNGIGRTERTSLHQKKRKEVPLSGTELFVELKSPFKQKHSTHQWEAEMLQKI